MNGETSECKSESVLFYLLAVDTLQSKLLLIAGQAVVVGVLQDEAPGADGLLATVASETVLMPTVSLMLHLFRAWWVEGEERERHGTSQSNKSHFSIITELFLISSSLKLLWLQQTNIRPIIFINPF